MTSGTRILYLAMSLATLPAATPAAAAPIMLQITRDTLAHGTAVLSGEVPLPGLFDIPIPVPEVRGTNWLFDAEIRFVAGAYYLAEITAEHLTRDADGEAAPTNIRLTVNGFAWVSPDADRLTLPSVNDFASLPHPGSERGHRDTLRLRFDDLNGSEPGFMLDRQLSAVADARHIPEPSALALVGLGLLGLALVRARAARRG
jgi:hypothetical protein